MGESTRGMIQFTDQIVGNVGVSQELIDDSLTALADAAVEVSKRNEILLAKLEDSNEKYAGLLAVQTAVLERNWAAAYNLAGQAGVEEQHLLRDLRWALERVLGVYGADSYEVSRARIIAGRFSIPLGISMNETLTTVEDYEDAFEDDELEDLTISADEEAESKYGFRFELVEEASAQDLDELADVVAEELREDEEFHQTFKAALDAALKRLSPEVRKEWELALGRQG